MFDMGGKFDKSFNEAAYNGAERFKKEIRHRVPRLRGDQPRPSASRRCATWRAGGSPIVVGIGFAQASGMEKVAKEFPETKFAIIDAVVDLPNVAVDRLQGARGLLPGRHGRGDGLARPARSASSAAWTSR